MEPPFLPGSCDGVPRLHAGIDPDLPTKDGQFVGGKMSSEDTREIRCEAVPNGAISSR